MRPTTRHATLPPGASAPASVLMPGAGAGEWELCRAVAGTAALHGAGDITRQVFATLDTAAANLLPAEPFVFALPVEMGLVQRLTLPAAEGDELEEMARIQLEKSCPIPPTRWAWRRRKFPVASRRSCWPWRRCITSGCWRSANRSWRGVAGR